MLIFFLLTENFALSDEGNGSFTLEPVESDVSTWAPDAMNMLLVILSDGDRMLGQNQTHY